MKKYFCRIAMLLFVLNLNAQQPQNAEDLFEYLQDIVDIGHKSTDVWIKKYLEVKDSNEYYLLKDTREKIINLIDIKIESVNSTPDIGGSEKLRQAVIDYLIYKKQVINECYLPFEKLTQTSTKEEKDILFVKLSEAHKTENLKIEEIEILQNEYGLRNDFMAEPVEDIVQ